MHEFIAIAEQLAQASARIIRRHFRTHIGAEAKADGSPVTIADKQAEEAMRAVLARLCPDHGIVGEEFGSDKPDAAYQWTLDPIDGTKNFLAGSVLFGTLIGLLHNGQPILGVINQPITEQFLVGSNDEARLNGERVQVRRCERIEEATLLNTTHWGVEQYHDMAAYEALTRRVKLYRTWGDCHGYYLLATGYADIMCDPTMKVWDVAPLIPIIQGAGGTITDWYGNSPIGGYGAVATAGPLHNEVIRALNPDQP